MQLTNIGTHLPTRGDTCVHRCPARRRSFLHMYVCMYISRADATVRHTYIHTYITHLPTYVCMYVCNPGRPTEASHMAPRIHIYIHTYRWKRATSGRRKEGRKGRKWWSASALRPSLSPKMLRLTRASGWREARAPRLRCKAGRGVGCGT